MTGIRSFTPREIVGELDRYVVGQRDAKRMVAIALRNRWRRQQVSPELRDEVIPNVPVFINTFYPPNQPTVARCYKFGRALGRSIASWQPDKRVAIIASGGLSHFVIDEDFDREALAAMEAKDEARMTALPADRFRSGTSEVKNWIPVAAALAETDLEMNVVDYIPCYRSEAGTGNAMGFAFWR